MSRFFTAPLAYIGIVLLAIPATAAHAQQTPTSQSSLALSPAIIEDILTPGQPSPFKIQVNNITKFPLPVKAFVRDFTIQSVELEKTEKERLNASEWIKIDEPDFILQPNQMRTVEGAITAPADAIPGGHYATIYFQPLIPREVLSPASAYMNSQVGALVFLSVRGDITEEAQLVKGLGAPGFVQHGPVDFTFAIRSSGNVHIMPTGTIKIFDWRGKQVASLDVPPAIILPNATKEYTVSWDAPRALGKYRAELEIKYGDQSLKKSTAEVWIMPWTEIIIGLIVLVGGVFVVIKARHRWGKAWRVLRGKDVRFGN